MKNIRLRVSRLLGALLLLGSLVGCSRGEDEPKLHTTHLKGEALGTTWSAAVVTTAIPDEATKARMLGHVEAALARVNDALSTYKKEAELARFNRRAGSQPFQFSPEARAVIAAALAQARETGGAFDPTVRPLVRAWGFGAGAASDEPDAAALAAARARVGWQRLVWTRDGALSSEVPGVELDLSAIAKGYAVDAALASLAVERPLGAMVEVGGEVRVFGVRADGSAWRLGVEYPSEDNARKLHAVVELTAGALATSGDYRQLRKTGGRRITHIIDPTTGEPIETRVASASVIAPSCMEADAVATALMVMGPDKGMAWIEARPWLEAMLLLRDGDTVSQRRESSGWQRLQTQRR